MHASKQVSKYVVLIVVVPCGGAFAFILGFRVPYSETRFDEFFPLCHNVIKIRPFQGIIYYFGQKFELILADFICHWSNFHTCKWPNIKQIIQSSSHTGLSPIMIILIPLFMRIANSLQPDCNHEKEFFVEEIFVLPCGQSYKQLMLVIYESRVVIWGMV